MKKAASRSEDEVIADLERLACSPGYLHAIAFLCFRDNYVPYSEDMPAEKLAKLYSAERLIRTEIATVLGLAAKSAIDWSLPAEDDLQRYIDRTDALLLELHDALNAPMFDILSRTVRGESSEEDPFSSGSVLREAIFYGAESAYTFQYRDLAPLKYGNDDQWLLANRGFVIGNAVAVAEAIRQTASIKLMDVLESFFEKRPSEWTVLPGFTFTTSEISATSGVPKDEVDNVLRAFSLPDKADNTGFQHLNDFNAYNATPIFRLQGGGYACFQHDALFEAVYETPFYWMISDKAYTDAATRNRGAFLEEFSCQRLRRVFGPDRVWPNAVLVGSGGDVAAEIDTLVVAGNRAIIVQAKSKRMTLAARGGNDRVIRADFGKSVQASYDQGLRCADLITNPAYRLLDAQGNAIQLSQPLDHIFPFCLVSDHYPALSAQARQFLKVAADDRIAPPFVMDVFLLDAMTEMLDSPLYFLSYVERRSRFNDRVMASHELTILSYHLKLNLWVDDEYNLFQLGDDIATDLDLAMAVRRDGLEGRDTPDGILTRFTGTTFDRLVRQLEQIPTLHAIDLGIFLLGLSEDTARQLSKGIDQLSAKWLLDGQPHDFSIGAGGEGLTVHITPEGPEAVIPKLKRHVERKKYQQRATTWFGLVVDPRNTDIRFVRKMSHQWRPDPKLAAEIAAMPGPRKFTKPRRNGGQKLGRNDPCPCGSGKKFKRCCY